jgi:ABC-type metal ion transport system substrate-binding protein
MITTTIDEFTLKILKNTEVQKDQIKLEVNSFIDSLKENKILTLKNLNCKVIDFQISGYFEKEFRKDIIEILAELRRCLEIKNLELKDVY